MTSAPKFRIKPNVRLAIARMNMPQNEIARRCGVSSGYMSQLVSGARLAGPQTRQRLLSALHPLSFDDLFEVAD